MMSASAPTSDCPDAEMLGGYVEGTLDWIERDRVECHLAGCPRCREAVGAVVDLSPRTVEMASTARRTACWLVAAAAAVMLGTCLFNAITGGVRDERTSRAVVLEAAFRSNARGLSVVAADESSTGEKELIVEAFPEQGR